MLMLATAPHLILLYARVHRTLVSAPLAQLGVASGEDVVLAELWHENGLTQSELARRLALRRSTVTTVLRTMEKRGLVIRLSDEHDARVIHVRFTERGAALRPAIEGIWRAAEEALGSDLSSQEAATLQMLLRRSATTR